MGVVPQPINVKFLRQVTVCGGKILPFAVRKSLTILERMIVCLEVKYLYKTWHNPCNTMILFVNKRNATAAFAETVVLAVK